MLASRTVAAIIAGASILGFGSCSGEAGSELCSRLRAYVQAEDALAEAVRDIDPTSSGQAPQTVIDAFGSAVEATRTLAEVAPPAHSERWQRLAEFREFLLFEWRQREFGTRYYVEGPPSDVLARSPVSVDANATAREMRTEAEQCYALSQRFVEYMRRSIRQLLRPF